MATSSHRGGYDCTSTESIPKSLECPLCLLVFRRPHVTSCCGYHFCQSCIEPILSDGKPCPVCQEPIYTTLLHKGVMRDVNGLMVWCTHKDRGCQWSGELGYLDEHLIPTSKKWSGCEYEDVQCTVGCGMHIQRRLLEEHELTLCPHRPFSCDYCGNYSSVHVDVVRNHFPTCASYPILCPNNCGAGILPREEMKMHLDKNCPLQVIQCDFHFAGCTAETERANLKDHMSENWREHISLLAAANMKLHAKLEERDDQIQQLTSVTQESDSQIKALTKDVSELKRLCGSMQAHLTPVPPYDFTMPNVKNLKANNLLFLGPPFYSHMRGYKLRTRIRVNGWDHGGRGKYMSLYLFLMRGEYDSELEWPFKGVVTIQLVNTEREDGHIKITLDCRKCPFERETQYEMADWGFGVEEFISHKELFNKTAEHPYADSEYVLNDCMHLRIVKVEFLRRHQRL